MNSFFGDEEEDETVNTLVQILHDGLVRLNLLARRPNFAKWKKEFRIALDQNLVSATDMEMTLVWYMNNITRPFMPQSYSPSGFLDKYPSIRKRFLESVEQNVAPVSRTRMKEESSSSSVGLTLPPEGASGDLLDWYDRLVEDGESTPGEIARYAAECELRSMINR